MQTALYARRVRKAYDIVHGSLPRWCSSRGLKSFSPKLRTHPSCATPSLSSPQARFGVVLSSQANFYRVRVDGPESAQSTNEQVELLCKKRSLLRKKGGYVLVGDRVEVVSIDWQDGRGLVSTVLPRRTETTNPRVANVDHFALVFSLQEPAFEPFQVTRFLVAAESAGISCSVLLNKCDLLRTEDIQQIVGQVEKWGYQAIPMSARNGQGMDQVRETMVGRTSVLAGPSGVGKSSIINALRAEAFDPQQQARLADFQRKMEEEESFWREYHEGPIDSDGSGHEEAGSGEEAELLHSGSSVPSSELESVPKSASAAKQGKQASWRKRNSNIYGAQAVGNVGHRSKRGRHTTRSAVLLDLPAGGLLVDTPGFNYPAMESVTPSNIQRFFPEIQRIKAATDCKFANCTHVHEPQCAVRDAAWERYPYYMRILEEVIERDEVENTKLQMNRRRQQGTTKTWKGKGGVDMEMAKLEAKVHRRTSRNARKLQVRELLGEELDE